MRQIFLAPRSNETSYKNFESTILGGRKYSEIEPFLTSEEKTILSNYPIVSVWGNKESLKNRWVAMQPDDFVLFYAKGFFYYSARFILTKYDKELGRKLWPTDKDGNPWPCLFFVDNLKETNIPIQTVQELAEYSNKWDRVQGFQPLNQSGLNAITEKFGSIEEFIHQTPEAFTAIQNILEKNNDEIVESEVSGRTDLREIYKLASNFNSTGPGYKQVLSPKKNTY